MFDNIDVERDQPTEALSRLIHEFTLNVIENQTLIAMFWRDEKDLPVKNRENIRRMKKDFDMRLSRLLTRGVDSGEFEIPDIQIASLAIAGMITWTYTWYREDRRLTPEMIARHLTDMVLHMVLKTGSSRKAKTKPAGKAPLHARS